MTATATAPTSAEATNGTGRTRRTKPQFQTFVVQAVEADGTITNATRSDAKQAYDLFAEKMRDASFTSVVLLHVTRAKILMQRIGAMPE